jgi:hypothetical protein
MKNENAIMENQTLNLILNRTLGDFMMYKSTGLFGNTICVIIMQYDTYILHVAGRSGGELGVSSHLSITI